MDLLKPTIPCVIVHTTLDEFSNPLSHKIYWGALLNARLGTGDYDKSYQRVMVTKTKHFNGGLRALPEGLNMDSELADDFNEIFSWLLRR